MKKEYRNSVRTKKMIREAFTEMLGEKKSIAAITVGELADRADIAKSTFYNHYDDVYAVAEEFQGELMEKLSDVLEEMENDPHGEYDDYFLKVLEFLKEQEYLYRKVMASSDVGFFIEKLKTVISKKIFENVTSLPFSSDRDTRYVQIRFLTNACVDTMADYFKGILNVSIDAVGEIMLSFLARYK